MRSPNHAPCRAGVLDVKGRPTARFKHWVKRQCIGEVSVLRNRKFEPPFMSQWVLEFDRDEDRVAYLLTWLETMPDPSDGVLIAWILANEIADEIDKEILNTLKAQLT